MIKNPERFGKYEVLSVIGKGGMGVVYLARDPGIDRTVAVKTIASHDDSSRDELLKRLTTEARSAGRLQHRNIVTIHDFGVQDDVSYIVMEFIEGTNLGAMIARREPPSLVQKLDILIQLCDGIAYAHELGVLHRDLKPSNVALSTKGVVKILDFGLARFDSTRLTQAGFLSGTIPYMSPERINGDSGAGDDIFAIGAIAYEFLSGQRAFHGRTPPEVMYQVLNGQPASLSKIAKLPEELDTIIARALEKDVAKRFQSARELGARFDEFRRSPALKSYLYAEKIVDRLSDSTTSRRSDLDRSGTRSKRADSGSEIAQRLDGLTPRKTRPMVPAPEPATEPMTPATPAPPPEEPAPPFVASTPPFLPTMVEELPREEFPVVDEPMPTMIDTPMPAAPVAARVASPVAAPVASPVAARAIPATMADVPYSSVNATMAEVPFTAPATQAASMDELMPPPRPASRPKPVLMIVAAMIVLLLGVGGALVYRFATSKKEAAAPTPATDTTPALAQTVESQQSTFRSLRDRAGQLPPSEELQQALQSIDATHSTALARLQGNDFAAASAMLGDSIARLQQILAAPPPSTTPTAAPRPNVAAALDEWTRVNATIDTLVERAARDGIKLDSSVAARLAERKAGVFAMLEGGRIDEFLRQTAPLVEAYQEAIRRAAYARRSETRRAETKPVQPPPTQTVPEVVEAPPPPPVETATVGRAEPARPIHQVTPRVPTSMIRVRTEGTVVVEVTIDRNGKVSAARILQPVYPAYDAAALRAAKQWRFSPATINGEPAESRMNLEFAFKQ